MCHALAHTTITVCRADKVKVFEEELSVARDSLAATLIEGFSQYIEMNWMAVAAGVSRKTEYKLHGEREAAEQALYDKSERTRRARAHGVTRKSSSQAEYRRLD